MRNILTVLVFFLVLGGSSWLQAGPVLSCTSGSACDGNLYALWVVSETASSYVLEADILVTNAYTGGITDLIDGLALVPDNSRSFTAASLLSSSIGAWTLQGGGLNASGCNGSGAPFLCTKASGNGAPLFTGSTPNQLSWQFLIVGSPPALGDTTHLKYHYVNSHGGKVGSLGSFDVEIQCIGATCNPGGSEQSTPEPISVLLTGSGLFMIFIARARRH